MAALILKTNTLLRLTHELPRAVARYCIATHYSTSLPFEHGQYQPPLFLCFPSHLHHTHCRDPIFMLGSLSQLSSNLVLSSSRPVGLFIKMFRLIDSILVAFRDPWIIATEERAGSEVPISLNSRFYFLLCISKTTHGYVTDGY